MALLRSWLPAVLLLALPAGARQEAYRARDHYLKHEFMVPMRDGVRLFTVVYTPRDTSRRYPFLVNRTAYGVAPYGPDNYRNWLGPYVDFSKLDMIFVYQDVRGRFRSEGEFVHHDPYVPGESRPNSTRDMFDTVEWLLKNVPGHNGRVGQRGVSWSGWEASMGMIDAHPAIHASSPQAPPQDQFLGDDYHSGGAFQLAYAFDWLAENARRREGPGDAPAVAFDYGTPDAYRFFLDLGAAAEARRFFGDSVPVWDDYMRHGTYDAYWQARNVPQHLKDVRHPVLIVGGWFDAEDFAGPFHMWHGLERNSPGHQARLVVGPWDHGGWALRPGDALFGIPFGSKTGEAFRQDVELPFFRAHLKGEGAFDLPRVLMFETGGNRWRRCSQWPPAGVREKKVYLAAGGRLAFTPPAEAGHDEYVSDPARPVPYTMEIAVGETRRWVVEDQRFAARRPDVLVYESEPLEEDLTIAGPVPVELLASTSGADSDWVVKLIDVFPDQARDPDPNPLGLRMGGYQMLLTGDVLRGRFRNSLSRPEPMTPGQPTPIAFALGDRYHTFRKGHRLMVQVQGSWFPMFDRNPQTFVDIYHAKTGDYRPARQRVHRGGSRPSFLALPEAAGGGCPLGAEAGRRP